MSDTPPRPVVIPCSVTQLGQAPAFANHGERVRQEPPPGPGRTAALEVVPPEPAEDWKERARQRAQTRALGWSTRDADLMATVAAGRLYRYPNGSLREVPTPGHPGRTVADWRLHQLAAVGMVAEGEPDSTGRRPVRVTADGQRALTVWTRWWVVVPRTQREEETGTLRPLLGGEMAEWLARQAQAEEKARREHAEAFAAAAERQRDWDDGDERMRAAWARVEGIRNPCARRPVGWVPTDEEAAAHRLDPSVVEELRADAADPQPRPVLPSAPSLEEPEPPQLTLVEPEAEQLNLFGTEAD
jgi:hypothetical protein